MIGITQGFLPLPGPGRHLNEKKEEEKKDAAKEAQKAQQIARAVQEHVAAVADQDGSVRPISTREEAIQRGYMTLEGEATQLGKDSLILEEFGLLENGGLTKRGQAYALPKELLLEPENLELYEIAKKEGAFDNTDYKSLGESVLGIGKFAVDAISAIPRVVDSSIAIQSRYNPVLPYPEEGFLAKDKGEAQVVMNNLVSGSLKSSLDLGIGIREIVDKSISGFDDRAILLADQKAEKERLRLEEFNATEAASGLLGFVDETNTVLADYENLEKEIGEERLAEITKGTQELGNFLSPESIALGPALKAGQVARSSITARRILQAEANIARLNAAKVTMEETTKMGRTLAAAADDATKSAYLKPAEAAQFRSAARNARKAEAGNAARLAAIEAEMATEAQKLEKLTRSASGKEGLGLVEQKVRDMKRVPLEATGEAVAKAGARLEDFQSKLYRSMGVDSWGPAVKPIAGAIAGGMVAGPIGGAIGTGIAMMSKGGILKQFGNFARIMGTEAGKARSILPYWKRVAAHSDLNPVSRSMAHLAHEAKLSQIGHLAQRAAKGFTAEFPSELLYETIASGGEINSQTFKDAFAEALIFGSGAANFGGMVLGKKENLRQVQAGEELNFRQSGKVAGPALEAYEAMPSGVRQSVAMYAGAFPNLNWDFTPDRSSNYDPATNTVSINPNSKNALKPLVAHEINHYLLVRNQMEDSVTATLIGMDGQGGLVRDPDGNFTKEFEDFSKEYNERMVQSGLDPLPPEKMAIEYFVDAAADYTQGAFDTGATLKDANRSLSGAPIRAFVETVVNRGAVLGDLFTRMGGAYHARDGRPVMGTGLLADGIRELPEAKTMMRKLMKESVMVNEGKIQPIKKEEKSIPVRKGDKATLGMMKAIFETDENGNVKFNAEGDPQFITAKTDKARSLVGNAAIEAQQKKIADGKKLKDGELRFNQESQKWEGNYLSPEAITAIANTSVLNPWQVTVLRKLNSISKAGDGRRLFVINHPATIKRKGTSISDYSSGIPATFREIVPYGIEITKAGNIITRLMSVQALNENIQKRATSATGQKLYQGNTEAILADVHNYLDLHKQGKPTDEYFQNKYRERGADYKNFINSLFGILNKSQRDINPIFDADKIPDSSRVVRTYRLDRISRATEAEGVPLPFFVEPIKANYHPDGPIETK